MLRLSLHPCLRPLWWGRAYTCGGMSTMLVADANTNPYFEELCEAANEIAQLKAQVARLEKVVDGVLAQHLAGQEPHVASQALQAGLVPAPDAPVDLETQDTLQQDGNAETDHDADAHNGAEDEIAETQADLEPVLSSEEAAEETAEPATERAAPLTPGSLPNALRTLICRPTKPVFTSPDDLTLIKGIDCALALQLAGHGIASFEDVAELNAEKIADLCAHVPDAHRIHKQVWIAQAAMLAKGELTTFARQEQEVRKLEEPDFALKPDIIPLEAITEDTAPDITASEIILDDKIDVERGVIDEASAALRDLSLSDLPRHIYIERPMTDLVRTGKNATSFIPMAATDSGFAVQKIAHVAPRPERDFGNMRALTASLAAAAVIYVASTTTGAVNFDTTLVQFMQTDVCELATWSSYPDACKQILGRVL